MASTIAVTSADITAFAATLRQIADGLTKPISDISFVKVTPADTSLMPEAAALKEALEGRAGDLKNNCLNLKLALNTMADRLDMIAAKYDSTEELNEADIEDVKDTIADINQYLPGADKALPQEKPPGLDDPPNINKKD